MKVVYFVICLILCVLMLGCGENSKQPVEAQINTEFPAAGQLDENPYSLEMATVVLAPANSDVCIWKIGPYTLWKNKSFGYEVQFRIDKVMQNGKEMYHSVIDMYKRQLSNGKVVQTLKMHSPTASFWSVLSAGSRFLERAPYILMVGPSCSECSRLGSEWLFYCQTFCGCVGSYCVQL